VPANSAPTITFGTTGGVALAQGNTLRGLDLSGADGTALSGTQVGNLVLDLGTIDVERGAALDLTDGSVAGTVGPITASDSPADVVRLNQLGGTLNLAAGSNPAAVSATNTAGSAVHVNAPAALTVNGAVLDLNGTPGNGLEVTANAGTLTVPGGTINNANGTGILVDGGTGTFTAAAGVTGGAGHSVQILDLAAPARVTLSGAISDHGTGIVLGENAPGSAVALTGALDLSTGTHDAFSATYTGSSGDPQGGTVTVTGSGNVATTTTGVAVKDVNVPIATAGLNFQNVSATGAPNGILLRNTGVDPALFGGLHVTGTSSANSGGAIANATTGVVIDSAQASLAKLRISRSTANGLELTDAKNVTLSGVTVEDSAGDGIHGTTVTNLVVNGQSVIQRSNGSAIEVTDLLGNSVVQATSLVSSFGGPQIDVRNSSSSNPGPDVLQLTGVSFSDTPSVGLKAVADGANLQVNVGSANPSPLVTLADGTTGVYGQAVNGGHLDVQVTKLLRSFGSGDAVALDASGADSKVTFNVFDNTSTNGGGFRNPGDAGVRLTAEDSGTLSGTVSGNEIVQPSGDGVVETATSGGRISAHVESNQITKPGCLVGSTDRCGTTADQTDCPVLVPPTVPPLPPIVPPVAVGVAVSAGDPATGDSGGVVDGTIASNGITDPLTAGLTVDVRTGNSGTLDVSGNRVIQTFNCAMGSNVAYGSPAAPLQGVPVPSPISLSNEGGTLDVTGGVNTVTLTKSPDNAISVSSDAGGTGSVLLNGDRTTKGYVGLSVTATAASTLDFAEANATISQPSADGVGLVANDATLNPAISNTTVAGAGGTGIDEFADGGALAVTGGGNTVTLADTSPGDGIRATALAGANASVQTTGDSVDGGTRGFAAAVSDGASLDAGISTFTSTDAASDGIAIDAADTGTALSYDIDGAKITTPGGDGIRVNATGDVHPAKGSIVNSTVSGAADDGIHVVGGESVTVSGNQVSGTVEGYGVDAAANAGSAFCLMLTDNSSEVDAPYGYLLDDSAVGAEYYLAGYTPPEPIATWASDNGNLGSLVTAGFNFRGPTCP
jgi:hypothetical protein